MLQSTTSPTCSLPASMALTTRPNLSKMMLQSLNEKSADEVLSSAQCPTCLGNPASMLPFLTAQANSVFSMASGNQGCSPSAGGILTASTQATACNASSMKHSESGLSVGLELGNGWKVVGLTSLANLPLPISPSAQHPQGIPVNSYCSEPDTPTSSSMATGNSEAGISNKGGGTVSAQTLLSSLLPGEWKVVGLTSLNPTNPDVLCSSKTAAVPAQDLKSPDGESLSADVIDSPRNDSRAGQNNQLEQPGFANNHGNDLHLPSLADLAAGTSEWKIAGVTTLVRPMGASVAGGSDKLQTAAADTATSITLPANAPVTSVADTPEWKVVGVTSLHSQSLNSPPAVASSVAPIPVVVGSASPLVTLPIPSAVTKDVEWKVVGMVPLQHNGETSSSNPDCSALGVQQTCDTSSESPVQVQTSNQEVISQHETLTSIRNPDKGNAQKSWTSSRLIDSKKWASKLLDRREDPSHPLGFLKNCTNQFRNAVLKRNTVSTMLELKRAFQDMGKKEKLLPFLEGMNRHPVIKNDPENLMDFAFKHLSDSKDVDSVEQRLSSAGSHISPFQQHARLNQVMSSSRRSNRFPFQNDVAENKTFYCRPPKSDTQTFAKQLTSPETDDKVALSMAYRKQMEKNDMLTNMDTYFSTSHSHSPSQKNEEERTLVQKQTFTDSSLQTIKSKYRQSVISATDFDSDSVNLKNVDPWGVCTSEDFGDIAEMVTEKGENKISHYHSSSRKRKLTTPRKMVQ